MGSTQKLQSVAGKNAFRLEIDLNLVKNKLHLYNKHKQLHLLVAWAAHNLHPILLIKNAFRLEVDLNLVKKKLHLIVASAIQVLDLLD